MRRLAPPSPRVTMTDRHYCRRPVAPARQTPPAYRGALCPTTASFTVTHPYLTWPERVLPVCWLCFLCSHFCFSVYSTTTTTTTPCRRPSLFGGRGPVLPKRSPLNKCPWSPEDACVELLALLSVRAREGPERRTLLLCPTHLCAAAAAGRFKGTPRTHRCSPSSHLFAACLLQVPLRFTRPLGLVSCARLLLCRPLVSLAAGSSASGPGKG